MVIMPSLLQFVMRSLWSYLTEISVDMCTSQTSVHKAFNLYEHHVMPRHRLRTKNPHLRQLNTCLALVVRITPLSVEVWFGNRMSVGDFIMSLFYLSQFLDVDADTHYSLFRENAYSG